MALHEYEILEKMATGTFGIVFKVRRITDLQLFVMKRIPLLDLSEDQRRDAAQEIAVMRDLHHPCVVEQKDAFLYNERDLCLILEYYDGGDMDTRMAAQRELDVYFNFEQVMLWFVQLVLGAQYLHAHHVVHRDIKTHNVFIRQKDSSVSLGDFGISERFNAEFASRTWVAATMSGQRNSLNPRTGAGDEGLNAGGGPPNHEHDMLRLQPISSRVQAADVRRGSSPDSSLYRSSPLQQQKSQFQPTSKLRPNSSTADVSSFYAGSLQSPRFGGKMEAAMKGTPLYMAPEVLQGSAASPKSDVWSLGCVLYELLALRHPFESRDLATLVMRVSRGQREPLPAHYPRPIQGIINHMLHLDAAQRPTCEEVLTVPCVRAYVELWQTLRTPLDVPASLSETSLSRQLAAWQASVKSTALKNPTDLRYAPAHHSEIERQLMPPASTPSEERETAEKRTAEAARVALLNAGPSISLVSGSSFNAAGVAGVDSGGDVGGVSEGTFFYGASGRCITGEVSGGMGGGGGGAGVGGGGAVEGSMKTDSQMEAAGIVAGVFPTASMRPFMVYDTSPPSDARLANSTESPTDAAYCGDSPMKSTSSAAKRRRQQQRKNRKQGRQRSSQSRTRVSVSSSRSFSFLSSSPSPSPKSDQREKKMHGNDHHHPRAPRTDSPDPAATPLPFGAGPLPSTSPPPPLRGPASPIKKLSHATATNVSPRPAPPLDEEALFFKAYQNVIDMRYTSMEEIAEAVVELRERVQQRMRHQRVLLDIEQLHSRHGSAPLQSMPNVLNVLVAAAAVNTERAEVGAVAAQLGGKKEKKRGDRSPPPTLAPPPSPEDVYAQMVRQIDEERGDRQRQEAMDEAWETAQGGAEKQQNPNCGTVLPVGRPSPTRIRQLREVAALAEAEAARERLQRQKNEFRYSTSSGAPFADPTTPLRLSPRTAINTNSATDEVTAQHQHRWSLYIQRRNWLSQSLTGVFDPVSLRAVYAYYFSCPVLQRDAKLVRRLVPDRSQWTALPLVEELVVLDRRLQPLVEKSE